MEIKSQTIDLKIIAKEFGELCANWKAKWAPIGHLGQTAGPTRIYKRMLPYLRPETVEAHKPEDEAHEKVVDYMVTLIQLAAEMNEDIPHILQILSLAVGLNGGQDRVWSELVQDVLVRYAQQTRPKESDGNDQSIEDIVEKNKAKIGNLTTFGLMEK